MAVLTECETHLLAMYEQLRENPNVQIFSAKSGQIIEEYGDAREVFRKISILHGISLDNSLQQCSVRFDWFSSHWRIERPGIQLTGEFTIRHLLTSMNVKAPDIEWGETSSERQLYSEAPCHRSPSREWYGHVCSATHKTRYAATGGLVS